VYFSLTILQSHSVITAQLHQHAANFDAQTELHHKLQRQTKPPVLSPHISSSPEEYLTVAPSFASY